MLLGPAILCKHTPLKSASAESLVEGVRFMLKSCCRAQMVSTERSQAVRRAAAAAVLALLAATCQGRAIALEADSFQSGAGASSSEAPTPIYFGNGCFWGRQKDYIDAEKSMGRSKSDLSAVVGYAGGRQKGDAVTPLFGRSSGMQLHQVKLPSASASSLRACHHGVEACCAASEAEALCMQVPRGRCATTLGPATPCMRSWAMQRWSRCSWTAARRGRRWRDLQT